MRISCLIGYKLRRNRNAHPSRHVTGLQDSRASRRLARLLHFALYQRRFTQSIKAQSQRISDGCFTTVTSGNPRYPARMLLLPLDVQATGNGKVYRPSGNRVCNSCTPFYLQLFHFSSLPKHVFTAELFPHRAARPHPIGASAPGGSVRSRWSLLSC